MTTPDPRYVVRKLFPAAKLIAGTAEPVWCVYDTVEKKWTKCESRGVAVDVAAGLNGVGRLLERTKETKRD